MTSASSSPASASARRILNRKKRSSGSESDSSPRSQKRRLNNAPMVRSSRTSKGTKAADLVTQQAEDDILDIANVLSSCLTSSSASSSSASSSNSSSQANTPTSGSIRKIAKQSLSAGITIKVQSPQGDSETDSSFSMPTSVNGSRRTTPSPPRSPLDHESPLLAAVCEPPSPVPPVGPVNMISRSSFTSIDTLRATHASANKGEVPSWKLMYLQQQQQALQVRQAQETNAFARLAQDFQQQQLLAAHVSRVQQARLIPNFGGLDQTAQYSQHIAALRARQLMQVQQEQNQLHMQQRSQYQNLMDPRSMSVLMQGLTHTPFALNSAAEALSNVVQSTKASSSSRAFA